MKYEEQGETPLALYDTDRNLHNGLLTFQAVNSSHHWPIYQKSHATHQALSYNNDDEL